MSDEFVWNFPMCHHGQTRDFNGLGTDDFKAYPCEYMAREVIQNSLDAAAGNGLPVRVEFELFDLPAAELRGVQSLFAKLLEWNESLRRNSNSDQKEKKFVEDAIKCLNADTIPCLRISDHNTTGMPGVDCEYSPFNAFVKGSGKSQKSENSGGSKGRGKDAIFVNSRLNCIFVSSYSKSVSSDGVEKEEKGTIGIAKFCSFKVDAAENADSTAGTGYCVENNDSAKEMNSAKHELYSPQSDYYREEGDYGTDIFVIGFIPFLDWEKSVLGEALSSFMPAFVHKRLSIYVSSNKLTAEINRDNLYSSINNPDYYTSKKNYSRTKSYFEAFADKEPTYQYDELGYEMDLYLSQTTSNPTNDAMVYRCPTEMRILSYNNAFCSVNYTGVLLLKGSELTKRLRSVEDVKHSKWLKNQARDTEYTIEEINDVIKKVKDFYVSKTEKFGLGKTGVVYDFDWAKDEWSSEHGDDEMGVTGQNDDGLPIEKFAYEKRVFTKARKPMKKKGTEIDPNGKASTWEQGTGEEGTGEEQGSFPSGHNKGKPGPYHPGDKVVEVGEGDKKMMIRKNIKVANSRMPARDPKNGEFTFIFTPNKSGNDCIVEIKKSGTDGNDEDILIYNASCNGRSLVVEGGKIELGRIEKGQRYSIDLKMNVHMNFVWEVNVNAEND